MAVLRFGGGLNQLGDESIDPEECTDGENFLLNVDSRDFLQRPGFDLKGTATNAAPVRGIMQLVKRDDSETTLIQAGEKVYEWDGTTFTDETPTSSTPVATSSLLRGTYWSLDDLLVITDVSLQSPVWQWDGTTMSEMTHAIAGVTDLYAKYSIVWNDRVWLFNIKTDGSLNPHMILASEHDNYDNFDTAVTPTATALTYSDPFFLLSPDLKPINGVALFFDTIVFSTVDGVLFKLTGQDATDYAVVPYYTGSAACGDESIANIGNDVVFVRRGGKIETLRATEQFGDAATDDISIKIPDEVSGCTGALVAYDSSNQRVAFFPNEGGKVLVYDKYTAERSQLSPWMKWTTQMTSALDVEAATLIRRPGTTTYSIYFGGPAGQVYDLNGSGTSDPGDTLIKTTRRSYLISQADTINEFVEGRIQYRRKAEVTLGMEFEWTDEYADTICQVPLKALLTSPGTIYWGAIGDPEEQPAYWSGDYYWNTAGAEEDRVSTVGFSAVGKGPSFFLILTLNTGNEWHINKIETPN